MKLVKVFIRSLLILALIACLAAFVVFLFWKVSIVAGVCMLVILLAGYATLLHYMFFSE